MGSFDGILKNKIIQNVFLGQFKKIIKEENMKCIVIRMDEKGEMQTEVFSDEVEVMLKSDYDKLINSLKSQL
jgi:hypothetical protein